jgi:hypothetical protein
VIEREGEIERERGDTCVSSRRVYSRSLAIACATSSEIAGYPLASAVTFTASVGNRLIVTTDTRQRERRRERERAKCDSEKKIIHRSSERKDGLSM